MFIFLDFPPLAGPVHTLTDKVWRYVSQMPLPLPTLDLMKPKGV